MDSKHEELAELTALLKGELPSYQQFLIEKELKAINRGFGSDRFNCGFQS